MSKKRDRKLTGNSELIGAGEVFADESCPLLRDFADLMTALGQTYLNTSHGVQNMKNKLIRYTHFYDNTMTERKQ